MSGTTNTFTDTSSHGVTDTTGSSHGIAETDVNPTTNKTPSGNSTHQSHAKGDGAASIVPQKLQEKLPESVERAVPNALHDTGDEGGAHRKQT